MVKRPLNLTFVFFHESLDFCRKEISCETLTRLLDEDSSMSGWKTVTLHWSKLSDMFYFCTAVVIVATWIGNQSERSKNFLDQSESRISPMWLIDVTNAHIWAWFYTWPHGIKNTRTQELNLHSSHSFNDRVEPGYKRDVCDALVTSRAFFGINTQNKYKVFAS